MWEMCKLSDIEFIGLVKTAQSCCFSSLKVLVYFDVSNPKREKSRKLSCLPTICRITEEANRLTFTPTPD